MADFRASSGPFSMERVARILARLTHRFADREAILWRGGLDESRWTAMERELLRKLDSRTATEAELAQFARLFIDAREELTRDPVPASLAATTRRPSSSEISVDEAVPTVPRGAASADLAERFRSTANLGTPATLGAMPPIVGIPPRALELDDSVTDDDPLSATLHSDGRAKRAPPR